MINNDVEDLIVTLLMIMSQTECDGRVRIGHEGDTYIVDLLIEREDDMLGSSDVGRGRTLAQALRALLFALQRTEAAACMN